MKPSAELLACVPRSADDVDRVAAMLDELPNDSQLQPNVDEELIQAILALIGQSNTSSALFSLA